MKNIAIYFSGRVEHKNYNINKKELLRYKDKYNVVYFCSLNKNADSKNFIKIFCDDLNITEDRINIEETQIPNEIINSDLYSQGNLNNMYSMFYHNYKCIELIKRYQNKNNFIFDCVVRYRSEVYGKNILHLNIELIDNTVYIPNKFNWGGINDQIAFGNFSSMYTYSKSVLSFLESAKKCKKFHPETILLSYLENSNLNIEKIYFDYILNKY